MRITEKQLRKIIREAAEAADAVDPEGADAVDPEDAEQDLTEAPRPEPGAAEAWKKRRRAVSLIALELQGLLIGIQDDIAVPWRSGAPGGAAKTALVHLRKAWELLKDAEDLM